MTGTYQVLISPIVDLQTFKLLPSFNKKYPEKAIIENINMCGSKHSCDATSYRIILIYIYIIDFCIAINLKARIRSI